MEPFLNQAFQDFNLNLSHNLRLDFLQPFIPYNMKLRLLLFQLAQPGEHHRNRALLRQTDGIGEHRLQYGGRRRRFGTQPFPRMGVIQTGHSADAARLHFIHQLIFIAGIDTDLVYLLFPYLFLSRLPRIGQHGFYLQASAGYFHISKTISLIIPGNFKDLRPEGLSINRHRNKTFQSIQEFIHTGKLQG